MVGGLLQRAILLSVLVLSHGCTNSRAKEGLTIQPDSLMLRRLQTRTFSVPNETTILSAAVSTLQDQGFTIDQTESDLGLVVASKNRDASSLGEVVARTVMGGVSESQGEYDVEQRIRASVVTRRVEAQKYSVRITYQRMVWNNRGAISTKESLEDPEIYRTFFNQLSQSLLLAQ